MSVLLLQEEGTKVLDFLWEYTALQNKQTKKTVCFANKQINPGLEAQVCLLEFETLHRKFTSCQGEVETV